MVQRVGHDWVTELNWTMTQQFHSWVFTQERWKHTSTNTCARTHLTVLFMMTNVFFLVVHRFLIACRDNSTNVVTPWTIQCMEFFRPEYWTGLPFPSPGDPPNPGLLICRRILYQLSHNRSPRILEWVAYPFSLDHSNPGMESGSPDCRQVLYQLSYQGSSCGDGNTLIDCIDVNIVVLKLSFSFVRCFLWGKMDKGLMESLYYFL